MEDTSVKVAVRIRPLLKEEIQQRCTECIKTVGNEPQITFGNDQNFTFDDVFGTKSSQNDIYEDCVANLVEAIFEGFNATVLAYGQTSSGKTYTMGSSSNVRLCEDEYGIIPRVARHIFDNIQLQETEDLNSTYRVHIQFLEIYGEEIRDLLDPNNCTSVTIRETPSGGVYVSGAREELTTSSDEMLSALERGSMVRTTGSTHMNESSSRSHAIFTVILERTIHHPAVSRKSDEVVESGITDSKVEEESEAVRGENIDNLSEMIAGAEPEVRKCKFHFVDLAGSERAKRTGAEGIRLREGIDINKGLLALGNVISALGDEQKRGKVHIPYRDSKLTRMLQDSLGGNSKTQMICCVSPADSNYSESLNAVRYANRARNIRNKPIINLDPTAMIIQDLRSQLKVVAVELLAFREGRHTSEDSKVSESVLRDLAVSKSSQIPSISVDCAAPVPAPQRNRTGALPKSHAPPAVAGSTTSPRINMEAIKYEQECIVLKSRLEDSDLELQRVEERLKRSALQLSELSEQLVIMQSERDYYRMKCDDSHINSQIVGGGEDETHKMSKVGVIAEYIREIESLKSLNAKLQIDRNNQWTAMKIFEGTSNSSNEIGGGWDISSLEESDMSGVANVISSTEEQLIEEKRHLEKLENRDTSDESDNEHDVSSSKNESMAEKDRMFQRRQKFMTAEVQELNESIQLKELLVMQLQRSQKQYHTMKLFYEEKLATLCVEMDTKEQEKQKMLEELHELSLRSEVTSVKQGREEKLREKLDKKEQELRTLRVRQQELSHLSKVQHRSTEQLRKLESDISSMKRQRVDLARKLQIEKKMHLSALNTKAKEIDHLKRELTRAMHKVKKLGDEKERAELKTKEVIRENVARRKRENSLTSSTATSKGALSTRDSRRVLSQNAPRPNGGRLLSAEEVRTKKWLDKQVREIAARESAAEALRLQCEQQLALMHQKKQLEDFREPLRAVILKAKRIEGEISNQTQSVLTVDEEEALADCEDKIARLEGQLKYRNAEISRMELELRSGKGAAATHKNTVEILKHSAATSLPAAHQLIHLLFDIVVSTRKSARMSKDRLDASQDREHKLNEDLDDALSRLNLEKRHHEKELARVERDFEERLAGLFNHSNLSSVLASGVEVEGEVCTSKKAMPASWRHLSVPWHKLQSSKTASNLDSSTDSEQKSGDKYSALLALAHERTISLKSQLSREESRVRDLERNVDEFITQKKSLLSELESKKMENNFLEDECRMLRDMVEDFRLRVKNLEGGIGDKIIQEVREADEYCSEDDSDSVDDKLDGTVLMQLSSLGNEIERTGTVAATDDVNRVLDGSGTQQDIFDRLTNPSNFTGTQKNIFQKDVESNRAKVQQIKEGALAHRKKRDDGKSGIVHQYSDEADDREYLSGVAVVDLTSADIIVPKRDDSPCGSDFSQLTERKSRNSMEKPGTDRVVTTSPNMPQSPPRSHSKDSDVFSRLLNPSKYTGIHRRKKHLPESPGSPGSNISPGGDDSKSNATLHRNSRRLRSASIDRMGESPDATQMSSTKEREKAMDVNTSNHRTQQRRIPESKTSRFQVEKDRDYHRKSPGRST